MPKPAKKQNHNEAIVKSIHLFSNDAFTLAKSFVASSDAEPLKQKANTLKTQVPEFAERMQEADPEYRADLNQALSEARLDLEYVLAEGKRPSSIRLAHVIRENEASAQ